MHVVTATNLNLRSQPVVTATNRIATLPQGQLVEKLGDGPDGWWQVRTRVDGAAVTGFAASRHLAPAMHEAEPPGGDRPVSIAPVHLAENRADVKPSSATGRAFPIGDPARPSRTGRGLRERLEHLRAIVRYLDVERQARYLPSSSTTYCNIYAYDFCYLSGAYLPRVWWSARALTLVAAGAQVAPNYDDTVRELSANALYDWLRDFGTGFGWSRTGSVDALQRAANEGGIGLICAQHKDRNRSGHVAVVVPEHAPEHTARRTDREVHLPLQSQAGRRNFCYSCGTTRWWAGESFRAFGFWMHE